jgi:hypothetical protein
MAFLHHEVEGEIRKVTNDRPIMADFTVGKHHHVVVRRTERFTGDYRRPHLIEQGIV